MIPADRRQHRAAGVVNLLGIGHAVDRAHDRGIGGGGGLNVSVIAGGLDIDLEGLAGLEVSQLERIAAGQTGADIRTLIIIPAQVVNRAVEADAGRSAAGAGRGTAGWAQV